MPECPICIERKRTICACPRCATQACRDCMLRTAIENPLLPACVAGCRGLSMGELQQTIGPGLISKAFRPALRTALYKREEALIPSTMPAVEAVRRQEEAKIKLQALRVEAEELEDLIGDMRRRQRHLENRIWEMRRLAESAAPQDIKTILRCQAPKCLGYADDTGACLACATKHCPDCGVQVEEPPVSKLTGVPLDSAAAAPAPHVCDPNEVASLKEVAKSAKPCPSCGAPTTRISGCPQMWCTYCRTGYRFDSLKISKGAVSNPERDDYLRRHGGSVPRQPGDIPCGGFQTLGWHDRAKAQEVLPRLRASTHAYVPGFSELEGRCLPFINIGWWEGAQRAAPGIRSLAEDVTSASARFRARMLRGNGELAAMRVKLIMKRMTQEDFIAAVMRHDTRRRRDAELLPVFQTYETLLQDLDREWLYFNSKLGKTQSRLDTGDKDNAYAIEKGTEIMGWYKRALWIQELVQQGLDNGAKALGIKRLGRLGEDRRLRLN